MISKYIYSFSFLIILGTFSSNLLWAQRPSNTESLFVRAVKNAKYTTEDGDTIQMKNGKWIGKPYIPGAASRPKAYLGEIVLGDLNGDQVKDAVVELLWDGGGSGTFHYVVAVLNEQGWARSLNATPLGDRIKIEAIKIVKDEVEVIYVTSEHKQPLSSKSKELIKAQFRLQEDKLVQVK